MIAVFSTTLPVFLIIALGFAVVRFGFLSQEGVRAFGMFVLHVAMPALVFRAVTQHPPGMILNPIFLSISALGAFSAAGITYLMARHGLGRGHVPALVRGMGACFANTGYVGYPIATLVIGPSAGLALAMALTVEALLVLPVMLALADAGSATPGDQASLLRRTMQSLARNPLMLALLAGLAVSAAGLAIPVPVMKVVDLLAASATALALTAIGGSLHGVSPAGMALDAGLMVVGKLLLHPLVVALLLVLFPPLPPDLSRALMIFAAAPMMSIFPLYANRFGQGPVAAAAALLAVVFSFFTMSALIGVL